MKRIIGLLTLAALFVAPSLALAAAQTKLPAGFIAITEGQ